MAELFTTNYGFVKPQPGTGEPAAIEKINSNFDKVDKWGHVIWVNDGVIPATADLIEGAIVAERTSGKVWIAQKNVGGTFDQKFIRYPYMAAFIDTPGIQGLFYQEWGFSNYSQGVNSSIAQISAGRFVCPLGGLWHFSLQMRWNGNGAGDRYMAMSINPGPQPNTNIDYTSEVVYKPNSFNGIASGQLTYTRVFSAGTVIVPCHAQSSGGVLSGTHVLTATLLELF